jgi:5'(3')-deoxyribonucleotidase
MKSCNNFASDYAPLSTNYPSNANFMDNVSVDDRYRKRQDEMFNFDNDRLVSQIMNNQVKSNDIISIVNIRNQAIAEISKINEEIKEIDSQSNSLETHKENITKLLSQPGLFEIRAEKEEVERVLNKLIYKYKTYIQPQRKTLMDRLETCKSIVERTEPIMKSIQELDPLNESCRFGCTIT